MGESRCYGGIMLAEIITFASIVCAGVLTEGESWWVNKINVLIYMDLLLQDTVISGTLHLKDCFKNSNFLFCCPLLFFPFLLCMDVPIWNMRERLLNCSVFWSQEVSKDSVHKISWRAGCRLLGAGWAKKERLGKRERLQKSYILQYLAKEREYFFFY